MLPFAVKRFLYYSYQKGMMKMFGCMFCQIAAREKPARVVYEDEQCVAFEDIHPQAPVHVLVIPRKHIGSLNEELGADEPLLGHLLAVAGRVARDKGIDGSGYRTVINTNAEAGQTVFHLHVHVIGGKIMGWPPWPRSFGSR
jgi:histidine triad (HIT) family protein